VRGSVRGSMARGSVRDSSRWIEIDSIEESDEAPTPRPQRWGPQGPSQGPSQGRSQGRDRFSAALSMVVDDLDETGLDDDARGGEHDYESTQVGMPRLRSLSFDLATSRPRDLATSRPRYLVTLLSPSPFHLPADAYGRLHESTQVFIMPAGDWTRRVSSAVREFGSRRHRSCWIRGPYTSPFTIAHDFSQAYTELPPWNPCPTPLSIPY
jgi:hypothetical protein